MTQALTPNTSWALALVCTLTLLAPRAHAEPQAAEATSPPPTAPADAPQAPGWKLRFGVLADVGAPDGIGAAAVVRPLRWLRLDLGATTNTIGFGVRGGATLIPLDWFITPTLSVDAGHYFNADYNQLLSRLGVAESSTLIQDVGYDYASATLGLEMQPASFLSIFLQAGLAYWSIRVDSVEDFIQDAVNDPDITARPLSLRLTTPTLKLGLIVYF